MTFRLGVIGCGLKATDYATTWVRVPDAPSIVAVTDTQAASVARYTGVITAAGLAAPRIYGNAAVLLAAEVPGLDAIYVSTPHAHHAPYALAALEAGLHVLLEKPMALDAVEAARLNDAALQAGKAVVVAYQAALSPLLARIAARAAAGEFGALLSLSGQVWEDWQTRYVGGWKQVPALSGGGFIFDTGSHLLNAVVTLTGQGFAQVSALLENRGRDYELVGSVLGRLTGGAPVTLSFCGDTIPGCESSLTLYFSGAIVTVDIWGKWAEVRMQGGIDREEAGEDTGAVITAFMQTCAGMRENPSPPQRSLHLAELWDSIKLSAGQGAAAILLATRPSNIIKGPLS